MERAAADIIAAKDQLHWAMQELEAHPDFLKTRRAKARGRGVECYTLAWWLRDICSGILEDESVGEAGEALRNDSRPGKAEALLRRFIAEDRRDRTRFGDRAAKAVA